MAVAQSEAECKQDAAATRGYLSSLASYLFPSMYTVDSEFVTQFVFDTRPRLKGLSAARYMGNAVFAQCLASPMESLTSGIDAQSLALVAQNVQKLVNGVDPQYIRQYIDMLHKEPSGFMCPIACALTKTTMMVSNQSRFPLYKANFGSGAPVWVMDEGAAAELDNIVALPALGCLELRTHPLRGRGVFTRSAISKGTLVHISPVLLFGHAEYSEHGKHTKLDHYTYCWRGGFALALGLGSMFNHEPLGRENIGFTRDMERELIRYTALRDIAAGEELCICYGPNVWFEVATEASNGQANVNLEPQQSRTAEDLLQCFDL
ncbi:hypothetical protein GGF44_002788 [Coemansia sp. RSA 1694]|nr:hypothetical protein GGF44_002788 [Coemansia sp. RSA 1694]